MKSILIFSDWYFPAKLAGGPIQSIQNIVNHLNQYFQIWIYTSAYDLEKKEIMQEIQVNRWLEQAPGVKIYYQSKMSPGFKDFNFILKSSMPNIVYLNSMFSTHFVIHFLTFSIQKKLNLNVVLAPRGMLKKSALESKKFKKRIFLFLAGFLGLYKGVRFHATNDMERDEIRDIFSKSDVFVVPNLHPKLLPYPPKLLKTDSQFKLCFIGRIHPIKNLHFLIDLLRFLKNEITVTVIGLEEDKHYASTCRQLVSLLPVNINLDFIGGIPHDAVNDVLKQHHLFVLPTLGENYGHAIIEALSVGRPVLISDQTPWKNLKEYNAGWELPLWDKQAWINAIEEAASWDQAEFDKHCEGALAYAKAHSNNEELVKKYMEMFGGRETTEGTKEH